MAQSKIEAMLLDPEFDYLQPYFYNHPWALRCELGLGADRASQIQTARARARQIHAILFPHGADLIAFNYWLLDWSDSGEAEGTLYRDSAKEVEDRLRREQRALRFLSEMQMKYRHVSVKNLKTYAAPGEPEFETMRRNRIVCYADGLGFDDPALLDGQIESEENAEVSLVSTEHECILSVYDDRGCDIVFADREHMLAFYDRLRPFFLAYDLAEMERRRRNEG